MLMFEIPKELEYHPTLWFNDTSCQQWLKPIEGQRCIQPLPLLLGVLAGGVDIDVAKMEC